MNLEYRLRNKAQRNRKKANESLNESVSQLLNFLILWQPQHTLQFLILGE